MSDTDKFQDPERLDLPSASQMEIIVNCPGMPNLKSTIPPADLDYGKSQKDEETADMGTRIHKAFETDNTLMLSPEEVEAYNTGKKYEQSILEKWIADKALDPSKVKEGPRELRVWLYKPYDFPNLLGSAKLDKHWIYRDETRCCILILDLKSGWNPNLPPTNRSWQLKFQAVCLWKEEYEGVTDARVAYVKAKDKCESGDYCDYGEMDLKYSWDSIAYHSWMASQPDAPRHAGKHCRWCACKAWCPEAGAMCLLPSVIADMAAPTAVNYLDEIKVMKKEDLLKVWELDSVIGKILEAIDNRLKSMPKEELDELGLQLQEKGRKNDSIARVREAFIELTTKHGFSEEELWSILQLSLSKVAELQAAKTGQAKKWAQAWVSDALNDFIVRGFCAPSLVYKR